MVRFEARFSAVMPDLIEVGATVWQCTENRQELSILGIIVCR
jgi:hypothetical protein